MRNFRTFVFAAIVLARSLPAQEPEAIPPDDLAKAAQILMAENDRLGPMPIQLELAPEHIAGIKVEKVGAIIIPDKRLGTRKGEQAAKRNAKGQPLPLGQLWTLRLSPKEKEAVLPNDKLRLVRVGVDGKELELAVFALGLEKGGKKSFQLALYGKDRSPVLRVPLTAEKTKGAAPLTLAARRSGEDSGVLELKILGRYKAEIPVGKQAE